MTRYARPGVTYERIDRAAPEAVAVRSDVAGIFGIAERGPLDRPVPVTSFRQFTSQFGDFIGAGYLAYASKAFFENGGVKLWVVRVASRRADTGARAAEATLGNWRIAASSPGAWGDGLAVRLRRERRDEAVLDLARSTPVRLAALSSGGLARFDLIEVEQPGLPAQAAVVARVEAEAGALCLTEPGGDFPYPGQALALDPGRPARVVRVSYALDIWRLGRLQAHVPALSPVAGHARHAPRVLGLPDYDRALREGLPAPVAPLVTFETVGVGGVPAAFLPPEGRVTLGGGRDGLSHLAAEDFTGAPFAPGDGDAARAAGARGLRVFEEVDEVALIACPDILIRPLPPPDRRPEPLPPADPCLTCPPKAEERRSPLPAPPAGDLPPRFDDAAVHRVQAAMVAHCEERGDRFAFLDVPFAAAEPGPAGLAAVSAWRSRTDSGAAALLWPWVEVPDPLSPDRLRAVPPSGHILGSAAALDLSVGVHRAPANVRLGWSHGLTARAGIGGEEQLNLLSVNVIRPEPGRGFRLMGARTLSWDPAARYVNVRRLVQTIRRAVRLLSQWVVFEPNDAATRAKYVSVLTSFLDGLFARGAFAGASRQESFFVRCDEDTTTATDRDEGRLIALIGVAPAYPLEFIVLRVGRRGGTLEIDERPGSARAAA